MSQPSNPRCAACVLVAMWFALPPAAAQDRDDVQRIESRMIHVRAQPRREWSTFPETPEAVRGEWTFLASPNSQEYALQLRQQDVKQSWKVLLNDRMLGELTRDENDMRVYYAVPPGWLVDGQNRLVVTAADGAPTDDIRVGNIALWPCSVKQVTAESELSVEVRDADSGDPLPCRITVIDASGALPTFGTSTNGVMAVRPGIVYTARGAARLSLPAGQYTVYAGRGFEYSLARREVQLEPGAGAHVALRIRREVPTPGYAACDTHVHTRTHSGHGDATVFERMLTLAGEGIELPIATDHNVHIDHEPFAVEAGVREYFTPVIGNEVTTRTGHFNVFPVARGARVPNARLDRWEDIFEEIFGTPDVKVVILNHARDLHSGTRPFGPRLFNDAAGVQLEHWPLRFNAMEVLNSSATQNDVMQLTRDWMALLNRGYRVTPVGSSDSHDVARHFVGQGRTYIRCRDDDPAHLSVEEAVVSFVQGRVMVSYGLAVDLRVQGRYRSGEVVPRAGEMCELHLRVLGPHWIEADRIELFANGELIRREAFSAPASWEPGTGVKWEATWQMPWPAHDVHLVAVATGPGIEEPYWRTAKPYQPTSDAWTSRVFGLSGAIWIDSDRDGRRQSAYDYARRVWQATGSDLAAAGEALSKYDTAVAAQWADLYFQQHGGPTDALADALDSTAPHVREGVLRYWNAWRASRDE